MNDPERGGLHLVLRAVGIAALLVVAYDSVLAKLATDWWQISDYSYGILVAGFAFYLAWSRMRSLRSMTLRPSWWGVLLVAAAIVLQILGVYGAELFMSRVSMVVLLAGIALGFGGARVLRLFAFPLFVLLIAIPIPALILSEVTLPLQLISSKFATALLQSSGVPVLRDGNVIQLPAMSLEVAEACSGIRSLMSLMSLAVFYSYFREKSNLRRGVLVLASIPIAIVTNALRIFGTGLCVQYWTPDAAQGFFHEFSGWIVFLFSLALLVAFHRLLKLLPRRRVS